MEYTNDVDLISTGQIQMLYSAAGDYWEILEEICASYGVEELWQLKRIDFGDILNEVKALAATAPVRFKDL